MNTKEKKEQKRYGEEFKREVVEFSLQSPKGISQICREFGISKTSFYTWRKELLGDEASDRAGGEGESGVSKVELADQIRVLQKEVAQLKRQREILKKAHGTTNTSSISSPVKKRLPWNLCLIFLTQ